MPAPKPPEEPKSPPPVITYLIGMVVFAAIVIGMWKLMPHEIAPSPEDVEGVGSSIGTVKLLPLLGGGSAVSQQDLKNQVVLLNFWGTWCPPCRDELPHMAELQKRFAGRDAFRLLTVSCPEQGDGADVQSLRENTAAMLKKMNLDLPAYYDPQSATMRNLKTVLDVPYFRFPTTLLLDRRGVIRAIWFGYQPGIETEMERYIGMVLDEK
jgi:thiol-disulfide isomerase/thioredoxin